MKSLLLMLSLALAGTLYGQETDITTNVFMSREEFLAGSSSSNWWLQVIQRKPSDIRNSPGNDYKVSGFEGDTIRRKHILKEIWGVMQDDTLYVNGYFITGTKWYMKAETQGRFLLLHSALPTEQQRKELGLPDIRKQAAVASGIGSGVGIALAAFTGVGFMMIATPKNDLRFPIVYDIQQDTLYAWDEEFYANHIEERPQLQTGYATIPFEDTNADPQKILEFIRALNLDALLDD